MYKLIHILLTIILIIGSIICFILGLILCNIVTYIWFSFLAFIIEHISKIFGCLVIIILFYPYFLVSKMVGFCIVGVFLPNFINKIPGKSNNDFPSSFKSKAAWSAFCVTQSYILGLHYFCRLFELNTVHTQNERILFVIALLILLSLPFIGLIRIAKLK
jgi:hypothetical protein